MPIRIDFVRAVEDRYYCDMVIEDLENDVRAGDDLDRDRLIGILGTMRSMNEALRRIEEDDDERDE